MLAVSWDTIRLFLHVLAATVWVGGQLTLAALVPVLRRLGAEIPRAAARRFNQVAWPAFAVLILTGVWRVIAVRSQITGRYENAHREARRRGRLRDHGGVARPCPDHRGAGGVRRADRHQCPGRAVPRYPAGRIKPRKTHARRRLHARPRY